MRNTASTTTLDGVEVECTACGIRMASHTGSSRQVRYFHCPSCQRWSTSVYTEVFKADTKMRPRAPAPSPRPVFGPVKERLEQWLRSLDRQDPYHALGVSPLDSEQTVRERYRDLARKHHPDRGGNADEMRRINDAYERVVTHREHRRQQSLGSGAAATAA